MATIINYNGTIIKLTSKRQGVAYPWGTKFQKEHHRIFVTIDSNRIQFEYYCNTSSLDDQELRRALHCFLLDAFAYQCSTDFAGFCDVFGYEVYSDWGNFNKRSMNAYKGCQRAYDKWQQFGIDIIGFTNWLQEKYNL